MKPSVGKIERVALREVWKHEALDFTQWLQNNLDVLNGATSLNLVSAEREQSAGKFNVDLVAEDSDGGTIVIENQLEKSDHDHLGKLITYLAAFSAKAAIWVLPEARPEHIAAVAWLNESTSASFYVVKAEAIRIVGEDGTISASAPLMTLLLGPSPESVAIGKTKKELVERHEERRQFWKSLLERIPTKTKLHTTLNPTSDNWIGTSCVKSWLGLNYVIEMNRTRVELYIDRGISPDDNQAIYRHFLDHKQAIETAFDGELSWETLEGKRACRIAARFDTGGYRSPVENWPQIQDVLIDAMIRFEKAIRPYAESLP
jgi:PAS domain-containing protein